MSRKGRGPSNLVEALFLVLICGYTVRHPAALMAPDRHTRITTGRFWRASPNHLDPSIPPWRLDPAHRCFSLFSLVTHSACMITAGTGFREWAVSPHLFHSIVEDRGFGRKLGRRRRMSSPAPGKHRSFHGILDVAQHRQIHQLESFICSVDAQRCGEPRESLLKKQMGCAKRHSNRARPAQSNIAMWRRVATEAHRGTNGPCNFEFPFDLEVRSAPTRPQDQIASLTVIVCGFAAVRARGLRDS